MNLFTHFKCLSIYIRGGVKYAITQVMKKRNREKKVKNEREHQLNQQ